MARDSLSAVDLNSLFTEGRADLHRLDVYPVAASAWTRLVEDLHLRSMKGETSVNAIRWQHSQALITISGKIVTNVSHRQWDRASDHQRGMIERVVISDDETNATMIVTVLRLFRSPDSVEIHLFASGFEAPLRLYDQLGSRSR